MLVMMPLVFSFETAEVINDMLDKGLIKSDNSLLAPGYALPEFYTETGKYSCRI